MPRVYVSIGSNIDPRRNVATAINALRCLFSELEMSSVYESEAVGFEGDNFLNLVVAFDTDKSLAAVTKELRSIERAAGRERGAEKFSPRTLDLDVLLYGDLVKHNKKINVPREEISRYAFVLKPLSELAPKVRHPELDKTFAELWKNFNDPAQKLWPAEIGA